MDFMEEYMNIEVLKKIVKGLNNIDCTWAIGGSVMLSNYGLVSEPRDIDILIDARDSERVKGFMDTIGTRVVLPSKEPYRTEEFFGYIVDGTDIEFLGDFKIALDNNEIYEFILDEEAIVHGVIDDEIEVNFTTLEDWYVAYAVMKDPKGRIPLIRNYFKSNGISHENLFKRNLGQGLTEDIKNIIIDIMS